MHALAPALLALLYVAATAAYAGLFFGRSWARPVASPLLRTTLGLHALFVAVDVWQMEMLPIGSPAQALGALAFAVAAVYAILEWRDGDQSTGVWMLVLVSAFQLLSAAFWPASIPEQAIFKSVLFSIHVALAILGYAAFSVAAGYGFLYLRLYYELKRGRFSLVFSKLPPLETLERKMVGGLVLGFVALTAAVVDGGIWAEHLGYEGWIGDPKIIFTFGIWVLYGLALLLRRLRRWHAVQTAVVSLAGLGTIVFSLLVVNLMMTRFHLFER